MFNLMCFLTMSQFLWFLRHFSRSVGGCVLSTDGPRKDPRHTVQVSCPRRIYKCGGCLQQSAGWQLLQRRPVDICSPGKSQSARQRKASEVTSVMALLHESAMASQRVRELGPPFVASCRAVLRPCVGSSSFA